MTTTVFVTNGGVHQICVEIDKTHKFSENTGQGPWSEKMKGKNHCMCLVRGLYTKQDEKVKTAYNKVKMRLYFGYIESKTL